MNKVSPTEGQRTVDGTVWSFLAESLVLPAGLLTTVLLTRRLGVDGYGLFTLAAMLVAWIEWTITAMFSRATFKCVAEESDWRPVGTVVLRLHLCVSAGSALLLAASAGPVAAALGEPALAGHLRLFALDIPIFSLAYAHRSILIGTGGFRQRAWLSAARWPARLVLVLVLVALAGFSTNGAIIASIGASVAELCLARQFIRPALFGPTGFALRRLWDTAVPLFLGAMSLRLFGKLDLFMLKLLGGTAGTAGVYGMAQNLTMVVDVFAMSFSPLLLSTLTRLVRDNQADHARLMARDSLRLVLLMLPLAGVSAGASAEIVRLIAGAKFAAAGPLLAVLIFEALGGVLLSVGNGILLAGGKARWTLMIAWPLVPLAVVGHLLMIPRFGAMGAACVTTGLSAASAMVAVVAVWRLWGVVPPVASLLRSVMLCLGAFALAALWPAAGVLVVVKLAAISALVALGYLALGEFSKREMGLAWSLLPSRRKQTV